MNKILLILLFLILLSACADEPGTIMGDTPRPSDLGSSCTKDEYKLEAEAQMIRLQGVMTGIYFQNLATFSEEKNEIEEILSDINTMKCRYAYPTKQETLEDTARQFITALDRLEEGNLDEFQKAISRAEENATRFYDWSIDMN